MLVASLILIYTFFILLLYGQGFVSLLKREFSYQTQVSIPFQLITGLMIVTTLGSFASFFIRINWEFQAGLFFGMIILGAIGIVRNYQLPIHFFKNFSILQIVGFVVFCAGAFVILYAATLPPSNPDTGIYHAQTIHWIETYPVVPGLVNLHQRLGYGSSWLLANAIFSFPFFNIQSFHLLTGALFLIMACYFYQGIHELLEKKYFFNNFLKFGFFIGIFIFLLDQTSSPGTDAPATLLTWFIIAQTIQFFETRQSRNDLEGHLLVLLIFFCVTIKISSVPLLILALGLIISLKYFKNFRKFGLIALFSVIILLPFVVRNIIQTGYPIFPGFPVDLFNLDWTLPIEKVKEEVSVIHWFATLPHMPREEFYSLGRRAQTIQWFYNQLPRHKAILLFIMATLLFNGMLCVFKDWRNFIKRNHHFFGVYLTAFAGCAFWFLFAPNFRFGYGFLLAAVCLLGVPILVFLLERYSLQEFGKLEFLSPRKIFNWLILIVCISAIGLSIKSNIQFNKIFDTMIMPADYPARSTEPCGFANFQILCQSSYNSCSYSPFPCAISGNEYVEMRGEDYRDGFRYIPSVVSPNDIPNP